MDSKALYERPQAAIFEVEVERAVLEGSITGTGEDGIWVTRNSISPADSDEQ